MRSGFRESPSYDSPPPLPSPPITSPEGVRLRPGRGYFVTLWTQNHACLFRHVVDGEMRLNAWGVSAREEGFRSADIRQENELFDDEFVVMPNHIHGIVWIVARGERPVVPAPPLTRWTGSRTSETGQARGAGQMLPEPERYAATGHRARHLAHWVRLPELAHDLRRQDHAWLRPDAGDCARIVSFATSLAGWSWTTWASLTSGRPLSPPTRRAAARGERR